MEQEKRILQQNWEEVRAMLVEKEKELACAEEVQTEHSTRCRDLESTVNALRDEVTLLESAKLRLETQRVEMDKRLLDLMVEKESVEARLAAIEVGLSNGYAKIDDWRCVYVSSLETGRDSP